jgi:leucyl-tRNA synthetase
VEGANRFLRRLWTFAINFSEQYKDAEISTDWSGLTEQDKALRRKSHETLGRADDDFGRRIQFNTVVSGAMELVNSLYKYEGNNASVVHEALSVVSLMLSPIAPHICHALWQQLGYDHAMHQAQWMQVDESALIKDSFQIVAQVNGKVRGQVTVNADASKEEIIQQVKDSQNVERFINDKEIRKEIYVPGRLVNLVVS